jgi:hypothetical protein
LLRRVPSKGARQNQKAPHVCTAARAPSSCPVLLLLPSRPRTGGRLRTAESGPAVANAAAARLLHCTRTVLLVRRPPLLVLHSKQFADRPALPPWWWRRKERKGRLTLAAVHAHARVSCCTCRVIHSQEEPGRKIVNGRFCRRHRTRPMFSTPNTCTSTGDFFGVRSTVHDCTKIKKKESIVQDRVRNSCRAPASPSSRVLDYGGILQNLVFFRKKHVVHPNAGSSCSVSG